MKPMNMRREAPKPTPSLSLEALFADPSLVSWESADAIFSDFKRDVAAFVEAVDWTDPLFVKLGALHLAVSLAVAYLWWSRRAASRLGFAFLILLAGLILASEHINTWARNNHDLVAKTNYFDKNGAFITAVFSGPLLGNILLLLFAVLREVSALLIMSKRRQLGIDKMQKIQKDLDTLKANKEEVSKLSEAAKPSAHEGLKQRNRTTAKPKKSQGFESFKTAGGHERTWCSRGLPKFARVQDFITGAWKANPGADQRENYDRV
ncbi:transmembrane protein 18-domain-containing protein [Chytriomyces sp. MP71]|nr:transmembrane protein 18-domain-containing protein [Chytriomyces sp. MP71]